MRYLIAGLATLAAAPLAAQEPASAWGFFEAGEGSSGVGVQSADGSQLMLKCDKPGANEVYAVVATRENLVPPTQTFVMRPVAVRFDSGTPFDDRWRFYDHSAVAINKASERSLTRFLADLDDARKLEIRLEPGGRTPPVTLTFDVAGAKEAIAQVYESCKDTIPAA